MQLKVLFRLVRLIFFQSRCIGINAWKVAFARKSSIDFYRFLPADLMLFSVFTVYLHHETTQCFVKQSRDFVVLAAERVEVSLQW